MKKRHIYFNTSANTSQDLPWHHKRDTRKAAHPAGTAKSNRQALRRLNRLGITDIAIDPESLAPKKKRKKEMGKTLNLADCPVHSLPIEWRLAITKGRQAPDMGIDLGGSVDVDEALEVTLTGGLTKVSTNLHIILTTWAKLSTKVLDHQHYPLLLLCQGA